MTQKLESYRVLSWLALSSVIFHATATLVLHWLDREVNPLSEMVSAYLVGEYQLLSRSTFLALACALACTGVALATRKFPGILFKVSGAFVILAVVGFLGVAVAPQAARFFAIPTQPATVLSVLLLSLTLRSEADWRPIGAALVFIAATLVALFVVTIVLGIVIQAGLGGLANRLVLVLIYVWVALVVRGLLRQGESKNAGAA